MDMTNVWWLSFSAEEGALGVAIVGASTFGEAVAKSHILGINPGGEIKAYQIPDHPEAKAEIDQFGVDVFISKQELIEKGYELPGSIG